MKKDILSRHQKLSIHKTVLTWFTYNQKKLPWRSATPPDPYIVLLSEVMLQQTQTSRIAEKLPAFLEQFPTLEALAQATNKEIILAWQGMGYNNRALRLRDCAKTIVDHYYGIIPDDIDILRTLPGIGEYTSSAIASFAFSQNVPVVDVNIRRIFSRLLRKVANNHDMLSEKESWEIAGILLPKNHSNLWHQALMDIGSLFCTSRSPRCHDCPISSHCQSAFAVIDGEKTPKKEPTHRAIPHRIWRGKIIELLRQSNHHSENANYILHALFQENISTLDSDFLDYILKKLESNNLIELQTINNTIIVSLKE
ncbi:MAG: A/G-specific adenine glycosylase [Ignavibacteria bacterium]|jgi:A/G-specific adenine glycosylase|nr:A/G-specific adenine glycosylase [Ignavibacteria bacterium]